MISGTCAIVLAAGMTEQHFAKEYLAHYDPEVFQKSRGGARGSAFSRIMAAYQITGL